MAYWALGQDALVYLGSMSAQVMQYGAITLLNHHTTCSAQRLFPFKDGGVSQHTKPPPVNLHEKKNVKLTDLALLFHNKAPESMHLLYIVNGSSKNIHI